MFATIHKISFTYIIEDIWFDYYNWHYRVLCQLPLDDTTTCIQKPATTIAHPLPTHCTRYSLRWHTAPAICTRKGFAWHSRTISTTMMTQLHTCNLDCKLHQQSPADLNMPDSCFSVSDYQPQCHSMVRWTLKYSCGNLLLFYLIWRDTVPTCMLHQCCA